MHQQVNIQYSLNFKNYKEQRKFKIWKCKRKPTFLHVEKLHSNFESVTVFLDYGARRSRNRGNVVGVVGFLFYNDNNGSCNHSQDNQYQEPPATPPGSRFLSHFQNNSDDTQNKPNQVRKLKASDLSQTKRQCHNVRFGQTTRLLRLWTLTGKIFVLLILPQHTLQQPTILVNHAGQNRFFLVSFLFQGPNYPLITGCKTYMWKILTV